MNEALIALITALISLLGFAPPADAPSAPAPVEAAPSPDYRDGAWFMGDEADAARLTAPGRCPAEDSCVIAWLAPGLPIIIEMQA
jgi:hypothetical protein